MTNVASLAGTAALIGDPARAAMLVALMDGRALTATELAHVAGVAPPTASGHLGRMLEAGLLALERQGRHRYYRIVGASVAGLIESLMTVTGELGAASGRSRRVSTGPRDTALRRARRCYDHLAGEVAVGIATRMAERGQLSFGPDGGVVTPDGVRFLASLGVELPAAPSAAEQGLLCRPCLDWSERRPHMAGKVGSALYLTLIRRGWIAEPKTGRALTITPRGQRELYREFGVKAGT